MGYVKNELHHSNQRKILILVDVLKNYFIQKIFFSIFFSILLSLFFRFFHKNGLKSSFLSQIDHFKNLSCLELNFKQYSENHLKKKSLFFSET